MASSYVQPERGKGVPLAVAPPSLQPKRRGEERLYERALQGLEPAEVLPTRVRERLIRTLHGLGWTDVEVAEHARMTTYTACRIRSRMGLRPNRPRSELTA